MNCFVPAKSTHQRALYINAKYFCPIYALDIKTPIHQLELRSFCPTAVNVDIFSKMHQRGTFVFTP
jgi:hypothetical protein